MTWVTDSIFVAGGDYVRDSWADFQSQSGISAVITVSAEGPVAYLNPRPWAALWLPVDDEAAYRLDQLALGVRFIQEALAGGRKVLLHGPKGVHRTRPLLAGHLLAEGKSLARAVRTVEEKPWLPPYKGDQSVLEQLAAALAAQPASRVAPPRRRDSLDRPEANDPGLGHTLMPKDDEAVTSSVFIGIDPTAGKRPLNYAVLDADLGALVLEAAGTPDEVLARVLAYPSALVAVDAPQGPNAGLMASADYRAGLVPPPAPGRWMGFKVCEYLLKQRGIGLYNTPQDEAALPSWMRQGFALYAALREADYQRYQPRRAAPRQMLEVHPHACFTVLLGHTPTPKDLLEGRLQRQLVLYRAGLPVPDPMAALEELTAHHLLAGTVALPGLLSHDALDALAAAYTAYLAGTAPNQVTPIGDPAEGQIVLPIAEADLKARYTR